MCDLAKWVRCDGKTYCWDKAAQKVVEIKITDVPMESIPKDVLIAMLGGDDSEKG